MFCKAMTRPREKIGWVLLDCPAAVGGHLEPVLSGVGVNCVGRLDVGLDGGGRLALKYNAISCLLKPVFWIRDSVNQNYGIRS
jgi:hypothetical protein